MSKSAIITGGASAVGLPLTKVFLFEGWRVVMTDIDEIGEAIAKNFRDNVLWVETNNADWNSQANMIEMGWLYRFTRYPDLIKT